MTPLKIAWEHVIFPLITDKIQIDVCVNRNNKRRVELKTTDEMSNIDNLDKCTHFFEAFVYGFDVKDAKVLLRVEDIRMDSFEIKNVKMTLQGEHESRAIGRLSSKGGKTKFVVENATRMRIVIADKKVYILGTCSNLKVAKDALSSLILGSPTAKVYF